MSWHDRHSPPQQGRLRWERAEEESKVYSARTQPEVLPEHPCGDIKDIAGYASLEFKGITEDWRSEFGSHLHT